VSRLQTIFDEAVELQGEARAALLDARCGDDAGLRAQVERMLRLDASGREGFLEAPALLRRASAPPAPGLRVGERLGRYVVRGHLGAGGTGDVYLCDDTSLARRVALKLVSAGLPGAADDRLVTEARILARLNHPHVVAVHEVGEDHGRVYLVMELVAGRTLDVWARTRPWKAVVGACLDAARGVSYAHGQGVLHRDLKPANILVGDDGRVRVVDFGLASSGAAHFDDGVVATARSDLAGTPAYMAPELFHGARASEASDLFALACTCWQVLAGALPFDRTTHDLTTLATPRIEGVPGRVFDVLRSGLAGAPAERPADVASFIDALEHAAGLRAPDPREVDRRRARALFGMSAAIMPLFFLALSRPTPIVPRARMFAWPVVVIAVTLAALWRLRDGLWRYPFTRTILRFVLVSQTNTLVTHIALTLAGVKPGPIFVADNVNLMGAALYYTVIVDRRFAWVVPLLAALAILSSLTLVHSHALVLAQGILVLLTLGFDSWRSASGRTG
jgi:hypothetical protein